MITGVDYSYSGPLTAAQCHAAGITFVCRYVSAPGGAKNLTRGEVVDFTGNGVGIVVVFENGLDNPLGGAAQGAADAASAAAQVTALGLPGCPIYFAVDFDAQPDQYAAIVAYLAGAASVIGHQRLGVYGSNPLVSHVLDGGAARYAWAARAWGGQLDPRAHLVQELGGGTVNGVAVDWDHTVSSDTDYGQAGVKPAPPAPSAASPSWLQTLLGWSAGSESKG